MGALRKPDLLEQDEELRAEVERQGRHIEQLEAAVLILIGELAELRGGCAPDVARWRTPKQIEVDFHVAHSTVSRWVRSNRVMSKRIGGRILIDVATVPRRSS